MSVTPSKVPNSAAVLRQYADELDGGHRIGSEEDEPEGARYIVVSDSVACRMSVELRAAADELDRLELIVGQD